MSRHPIHAILNLRENPLKLSDLRRTGSKFGMTQNQMALLSNLSLRTFRNKPQSAPLSFRLSEQLLLLEDLYQLGLEVFDSRVDLFQDWLKTNITALENHVPNDLLTSQLGIDVVKEELLRIEHGVY